MPPEEWIREPSGPRVGQRRTAASGAPTRSPTPSGTSDPGDPDTCELHSVGSLFQNNSIKSKINRLFISRPTDRPGRHFRIREGKWKPARLMRHDYIRRVVPGREDRVRSGYDSYDSGHSRPQARSTALLQLSQIPNCAGNSTLPNRSNYCIIIARVQSKDVVFD